MRVVLFLMFLLALSGCAGKPTTYLALAPVSGTQPIAAGGIPAVVVSTVQIPPEIDRRELTTGTPPGALKVHGKAEWAGALGPMARIVLAQDLASLLQGGNVLMPGDPLPPGGARIVHVTIQQFMPDDAGKVSLEADWFVAARDGTRVLAHGRFARMVAGGSRPAAEAQSMSQALGELAGSIAKALTKAPA